MKQKTTAPAAPDNAPATERPRIWDHPIGFWFIFWGELAERASFYGVQAILALYLNERLGFSESDASGVVAYFNAAVYILPLLGGYLADHYFGKYRTIVAFSLPYIVGQFLLGIESLSVLYVALALLAMGSGVIKPNISPLMGMTYDQKRPGQVQLRAHAFAMFYFSINVGATISTFGVPEISQRLDYSTAFMFPAALMVFALGFFALGKRFYAVETISRAPVTPEHRRQQWQTLKRILGLFIVVSFFWTVFYQSPSTWTFFAKNYLDLNFLGWEMGPAQVQAFNPLLILVLIPVMSVVWRVLARAGWDLRPTDRMLVGFVLTLFTSVIMTIAGYVASPTEKISVLWELVAYFLITVAEICISVEGLKLAFTGAPDAMKSFVTGCWLGAVFLGNMLNTQIVRLYEDVLSPGPYFALLAVMMVPVTLVFLWVAQRFNRVDAGQV
jgi:POT family proton-dependent oligopeptide transporter